MFLPQFTRHEIRNAIEILMTQINGARLYVEVSASEARRRLKGRGYGVRRIESAGRNRAVVIHTATGLHLQRLESLFHDALSPTQVREDDSSDPQTIPLRILPDPTSFQDRPVD